MRSTSCARIALMITVLAVPTVQAADPVVDDAIFVGVDTVTQGTWAKSFGVDGYMLPDGTAKNPAYATIALTGAAAFTWIAGTDDLRAPTTNAVTDQRAANCWYSAAMNLDVACKDSAKHLLTIYALDWDRLSRTAHVDVLDSTGAVLDKQDLSAYGDGTYLSWKISGHITLKVTNTGPQNAVISGFFFGAGISPQAVATDATPAAATP